LRTGLIKPTGYSSTYPTNQLSPGVWGACDGSDLQQLGLGYYTFFHYENGLHPASLLFVDTSTSTAGQSYDNSSTMQINGSSTGIPLGQGHVILLTPGSTTAGAGIVGGRVGIVTRPLGPITPGGNFVWFEADVTLQSSTATQGAFVGLATLPGVSTTGSGTLGSTGQGIISTVTSTGSTNSLISSTGAIGFWMHGDQPNNFDAVYQNQSSNGSTGGTGNLQVVLKSTLTATTGTIVPGTIYTAPIGGVTPVGALTSTQCQKLGILYLPQVNQVQWLVNGYVVASQSVSPATFDTISAYGGIVEYAGSTTGLTAAVGSTQMKVDFFGAAAKLYL
jgi:hypothetical protein